MTDAVRFGLSLLLAACSAIAQPGVTPYVISTVAGTPHLPGDNGPATAALLRQPQRIAIDRSGNIYFSEEYSYLIRKVAADGTISTVVGTGVSSVAIAGTQATSSPINDVRGVAFDSHGNLYFSQGVDSNVLKVSGGVMSVAAGICCSAGYGGDGGPATSAHLGTIDGLFIDAADNLYLADTSNHRIRKVDTNGIIATVAGNGTAGFSGDGGQATAAQLNSPSDMLMDAGGNLYIADRSNNRVRMVTPGGIISTVAGTGIAGSTGDGGSAAAAQLANPTGLAMDAGGRLYVTEAGGARIRRITASASGATIETVAGNGTAGFAGDGGLATAAKLDGPYGVAVDSAGNLYVADTGVSQRIRKISPGGIITTVAGASNFAGDGGPATAALLNQPQSVAVDAQGNLYISDSQNQRIRLVSPTGTISTYAGTGVHGSTGDGGAGTAALLNTPTGIALGSDGSLYIADTGNRRIRRVNPAGVISTVAGNGAPYSGDGGSAVAAGISSPVGVAQGPDGSIYIAEQGSNRIRKVDGKGVITTVAGTGTSGFAGDGGPATAALLAGPVSVAVDSSGNLYFGDNGNFRLRKVNTNGIITTLAGNGQNTFSSDGGPAAAASIRNASGIAVDSAGDVFFSEPLTGRIRMVSPSGIITTLAGSGTRAFGGDGGLALSASLGSASSTGYGVALGSNGLVYFADTLAQTIRVLAPNLPAQLKIVSGNGQSGAMGAQLANPLITSVLGPAGIRWRESR